MTINANVNKSWAITIPTNISRRISSLQTKKKYWNSLQKMYRIQNVEFQSFDVVFLKNAVIVVQLVFLCVFCFSNSLISRVVWICLWSNEISRFSTIIVSCQSSPAPCVSAIDRPISMKGRRSIPKSSRKKSKKDSFFKWLRKEILFTIVCTMTAN